MAAGESHGDWASVAEVSHLYEAELMALRLREAGIEAEVIDQSFKQEPLPSVRSFAVVRVLVPAGKAAEARRILAEPAGLPEDAEPTDDGHEDTKDTKGS
jgi:hypothetical protein